MTTSAPLCAIAEYATGNEKISDDHAENYPEL